MTAAPQVLAAPRYRFRLRRPVYKGPQSLPWYVRFLLAYVAAITIIGKGPTYLGVPPVYPGEIVLATSLLFIAPWIRHTDLLDRHRPLTIAILLYLGMGAVWATFSFRVWGLDAIRDAAICYYALFYFVGLALASRERMANRVWFLLRMFWIVSMFWNTANIISGEKLSHSGPIIPGRGVHIFFNSVHEGGQNLALGAWVVLCTTTLIRRPRLRIALAVFAFLGLTLFAASQGRGMRIGMASGVSVALLLSLSPVGIPHFNTRLMKVAVPGVPLLAMVLVAFPERVVKLANLDRFAQAEREEGTAGWRLVWWKNIYAEVMKDDPAFGLGFGESLHVYQPLLASLDEEFMVRSPHNFNMTVFARLGFVGLAIWLTIFFTGVGTLFRRIWRGSIAGRAYTPDRRDELTFWLIMLVATVVNSSFGVLMEGPVLGVWFWFALGFALARSCRTGSLSPADERR